MSLALHFGQHEIRSLPAKQLDRSSELSKTLATLNTCQTLLDANSCRHPALSTSQKPRRGGLAVSNKTYFQGPPFAQFICQATKTPKLINHRRPSVRYIFHVPFCLLSILHCSMPTTYNPISLNNSYILAQSHQDRRQK